MLRCRFQRHRKPKPNEVERCAQAWQVAESDIKSQSQDRSQSDKYKANEVDPDNQEKEKI